MPVPPASLIVPPYLQKGDAVALVCPAGQMDADRTLRCQQALKTWGFRVVEGRTIGRRSNYFSGTDAERLADVQQALDDPSVRAVICARGGYGSSRIIDQLDWKKFQKNPKWIVGFSDITVFHSFLFRRLKTASIHGPMANAFNDESEENPFLESLKKCLLGRKMNYPFSAHPLNREGKAEGRLIGGNLSLLAHQIGTASDIHTDGCLLFLEDIGEQWYHIDRMLLQLDRAGKLKSLAGLIVGAFSELKDTNPPFGKTLEEIFHHHAGKYHYPIGFGFPVGHENENMAVKVGMTHRLQVGRRCALSCL
jgi:muramoyltetrapeptide carboxypeptidase